MLSVVERLQIPSLQGIDGEVRPLDAKDESTAVQIPVCINGQFREEISAEYLI